MPDRDDELEFASKEDLDEIMKDERLKRYYNATKAGVTKKFQVWGDEKKKLEDRLSQLESSLQELVNVNQQWGEWYRQAFPEGWEPEQPGDLEIEGRNKRPTGRKGEPDATASLKAFQDEVRGIAGQYERRLATLSRMFDLSMQLNDLHRAHPDMDAKKVLDTALKKGYSNLDDAYDFSYRDDLISRQVEEKTKTRLDEELAKQKVQVETGSGAMPTHFALSKETPKSMSEASKQVLEELKAGTLSKE